MAEIPQLYLADYFIGLRNEIDTAYLKKKRKGKSEDDAWQKIITRIEAFEKELTKSNDSQLSDLFVEEIKSKINNSNIDLEEHTLKTTTEELIEMEEHKIRKAIFLNKTITVFDHDKLVIVNGQFLTDQSLQEMKNW